MAVQIFVASYEASTEAAEQFCKDYSRWMELSSVTDTHALDELYNQYCAAGLTEDDTFTMHFDGDYKTSVDTDDMILLKGNVKYYRP